MKKQTIGKDVSLVLILFLLSRIFIRAFDIHLDYSAINAYWQYLDHESLLHNLLRSVWYDHAQPPVFNLLLGCVLKISGSHAPVVFSLLLQGITLLNVLLLLHILKKLIPYHSVALILTLLYLLSPATMIFESELFYTSFISMLLLLSVRYLLRFQEKESLANAFGLFLPLAILCLTRSMYHLVWLFVIALLALFYYRGKRGFAPLLTSSVLCLLLVGGWYLKNKIIFGSFSTSSWIGMNMARNVFHDQELPDSTHIEAIGAFSTISAYKPFISGDYEKKYAGLNDRDLLQEMKNDSFINMNHIDYIEVSKKYMDASKDYIRAHPSAYLKNVLQSTIIFFTPATRYPFAEQQARKIKYYDLLYSFNLSEIAVGKQQRRIALTVSSLPKLLVYLAVFFFLLRSVIRERKISLLNGVIVVTIGYVFVLSSLLEHYENMRFRYEIEPLFLILLGQVVAMIIAGRKKSSVFNIH